MGCAIWALGISTLAQAEITNGLVAYYPFNGNANDASGSGNDGAPTGSVGFTNTPFGTGVDFAGTGPAHLDLGTWLNFTNFTIGLWVYPRAIQTPSVLLDHAASGSTNWACQNLDGTHYDFNGASFVLPSNAWSYVVLEALPAGLEVYVNGQLAGSNLGQVIRSSIATRLWLGAGVAAPASDSQAWNGIVSNLRIYDRALTTNEVSQLFAIEGASNHTAFVWLQLCSSNQIPAQFDPAPAEVDAVNGIVYSVRRSNTLLAYNLASNTFTTLPASQGPGGDVTAVYDSASHRILGWSGGRGTVCAISTTGGVWQVLGGSGTSGNDYSNFTWWNPVTRRINTFGGYGGYTYHNWLWDFNPTTGTWTQLQTNQPGVVGWPWPRIGVNSVAPDPAGTRLFLWGGHGNSNGVQYTIDPGFIGWDNDGSYNGDSSELFADLWMFNYAANSWSNIVPVSSQPPLMGPIVYHPATASVLLLGGQLPPAKPPTYTNLVFQLRLGLDHAFAPLQVIGEPPASLRRKNYWPVAVLDAARNRAVIFTDDGVHALTANSQTAVPIRVQASSASGGTVRGSGVFAVGSVQQISATATSYWNFTGWRDGNTNATRAITVPLLGAVYQANFQHQTAVLTVQANPAAGGTVGGGGTNPVAALVLITASASNGWRFVDWNNSSTNAQRIIVVPATNSDYTANFTTCTCTLAIASTNVGASASSGQVPVTARAGCVWTATSDTHWIHTASAGTGNGLLSYTVDANPDGLSRSGTITVPGQTLTLTQAAAACTYALDAAATNGLAAAGSGSVGLTTLVGCPWTATSNTNWIQTTSTGIGSGPVAYTFAANPGPNSRTGTLSVQGQTYTVSQAAPNCTYALAGASTNLPARAGGGYVRVTVLAGCPWGAISNTNWLHTTSTGTGNGIVNYTFDDNSGNCRDRTGTLAVGGQTYTVTQVAGSGSYGLATARTNVAATADSGTVGVTAGVGCGWTAISSNDWIQTTSTGTGSGMLSFTVEANPSGGARSGTIIVAGKTLTITQAPAPCTYALDVTNANFTTSGGTGTFGVITLMGCPWRAVSSDSWLTITGRSNGTGTGLVSYAVADNSDNCTNRSGTVTVGGQILTVTQIAGSGRYALTAAHTNVTAQAGSGSVNLTAGAGCAWTAISSNDWIQTTSTGTGSGPVRYTFDSNLAATGRTGRITIQDQTFAIVQGAATAPLMVQANPVAGGTGSGSGTYPVGTNVVIAASAASRWTFTGWSDGNTNFQRTVRVLDGGVTYLANFSQHPELTAKLGVQANPNLGGTVSGGGTYAVGNQQQISASANSGWQFTDWADGVPTALRTITVPAGGASYTGNFAVIFSGLAPVLITPPVITNSLLVIGQQFLVAVGETNVFTVDAADPVDNARLQYQWIFGDGGTSDWSAAAVATHVYSTNNCGRYTASVTVSNGQSAVRSNLAVSAACQLTITRLQLGLNFARTNADSCTLVAKLDPAGITNVTQLTSVLVDVSNAQVPFILNPQGRGTSSNGSCRLVYTKPTKTQLGFWTLTAALSHGNWYSQWVSAGLTNATIKPAVPVNLMVGVVLSNEAFAADQQLNYSATHNRTGAAK